MRSPCGCASLDVEAPPPPDRCPSRQSLQTPQPPSDASSDVRQARSSAEHDITMVYLMLLADHVLSMRALAQVRAPARRYRNKKSFGFAIFNVHQGLDVVFDTSSNCHPISALNRLV